MLPALCRDPRATRGSRCILANAGKHAGKQAALPNPSVFPTAVGQFRQRRRRLALFIGEIHAFHVPMDEIQRLR